MGSFVIFLTFFKWLKDPSKYFSSVNMDKQVAPLVWYLFAIFTGLKVLLIYENED